MLVRATQRGYYLWLRPAGEVFDIPEKIYSAEWMQKVPTVQGKAVPSLNVTGPVTAAKPSLNVQPSRAHAPSPDSHLSVVRDRTRTP